MNKVLAKEQIKKLEQWQKTLGRMIGVAIFKKVSEMKFEELPIEIIEEVKKEILVKILHEAKIQYNLKTIENYSCKNRLKNGDHFYYITEDGRVGYYSEDYGVVADCLFKQGNYFKHYQDAI